MKKEGRFAPTHEINIISVASGDSMSGGASTETTVKTLPCEMWEASLKETRENRKDTVSVMRYFKIRYTTGITESMLVETAADNRRFKIVGIKDTDFNKKFLILMTEEKR